MRARARDGMVPMSEKPMNNVAEALARIDIAVWTKKSIRECVAIAARSSRPRGRPGIDVARVDAVLTMLVQQIEAERLAIVERGTLDM